MIYRKNRGPSARRVDNNAGVKETTKSPEKTKNNS